MQVNAHLITIGDEILYGQTLDTNSYWISQRLDEIGVKVTKKITIPDNEEDILEEFAEASKRTDIVLVTGGLGPTSDDLTKPCLVKFFHVKLELNQKSLDNIKKLLSARNRQVTPLNLKQAELPSNCEMIPNFIGTASGMWFDEKNTILISVPGVPHEMKEMMKHTIIPKIQARFNISKINHKIIKTIGVGESWLASEIKEWEANLPKLLKLAYLPSLGEVKLRLTGYGSDIEEIKSVTAIEIKKLQKIISKYIYGYDETTLEQAIGNLLVERGLTVSTAESCSGGYLAHKITSVPGSSRYFMGSIISYSNQIKTDILEVNPKTINQYGVVSQEVVEEMAANVRKKLKTDIGLATSGIAGPSGGSQEKPVGTVCISISIGKLTKSKKLNLGKQRDFIVHRTALAALNMLRLALLSLD